jgi:hypothetical protein
MGESDERELRPYFPKGRRLDAGLTLADVNLTCARTGNKRISPRDTR